MINRATGMVAGAALAVIGMAAVANATVVSNGSDAFFVVDQTVSSAGKTATLGATVEFSDFLFAQHATKKPTTTVTFDVDVANLTPQGSLSASDWKSIRLVSFGFDTDPNAKTVADDSADWGTTLNVNFPGFQKVDVCAYAGVNCPGGGNAGLHPGQSDEFVMTLTFSGLINSFDLGIQPNQIVATKWQTAFNSFEVASNPPCIPGAPGCSFNPPVIAAPEPSSLLLLTTFGLAMLGFGKRRPALARAA